MSSVSATAECYDDGMEADKQQPNGPSSKATRSPSLEEIIAAALQTKPMTEEQKKTLEEEYRRRERGKPGRKKGR